MKILYLPGQSTLVMKDGTGGAWDPLFKWHILFTDRMTLSHWVDYASGSWEKKSVCGKRPWKLASTSCRLSKKWGQKSRDWRKRIMPSAWSWLQLVRRLLAQKRNPEMNGKKQSTSKRQGPFPVVFPPILQQVPNICGSSGLLLCFQISPKWLICWVATTNSSFGTCSDRFQPPPSTRWTLNPKSKFPLGSPGPIFP